METFVAKVKKWGNSKGVILPARVNARVGEEMWFNMQPAKRVLRVRDIFGKLKTGANTAKALKEIDEEFKSKFD